MRNGKVAAIGIFCGLTLSTLAGHAALGAGTDGVDGPSAQATDHYVAGVITAVDARTVTIQGKSAVTALLTDKTRVTINGRPARAADLKIAENAKAEYDVLGGAWSTIAVSTK
jgi:hypothetical protein